MEGLMLLLLLRSFRRYFHDRNTNAYLGCQGIHIRMAVLMFTHSLFRVFFFDV